MSKAKETGKQVVMESKVAKLKISEIVPNPVSLRDVKTEGESYIALRDSIQAIGVIDAISVRHKVAEDGTEHYEIINGLHRYTACKELGLDTIPCVVREFDDSEVLAAQIIANVQKVETRPFEYTQGILKLLALNPYKTELTLAKQLGKSAKWIKDRLSLKNIESEEIGALIDNGKICLSNAYALAGLPVEEQANYLEAAMTEEPSVFVPKAVQRKKEIREAQRQGKEAKEVTFQPIAHMRKMAEIKEAHVNNDIAKLMIKSTKAKTALEGFNAAVDWALNLDAESIELQRKKFEEAQEKRKLASERKKSAKAKKKAEDFEAKAKEARKALKDMEAKEAEKEEVAPK